MAHGGKSFINQKSGQAIVEYALIIGAIALIAIIAFSVLGNKTADIVATMAVILPGAHDDDEGRIVNAQLVETTNVGGDIVLDATTIAEATQARLGRNLGVDNMDQLVGEVNR